MADTEASAPATSTAAASPKKKNPKPKKARPVANHPKIADMVNAAIANLKERGGSSLQAIKKYIATTYKVDVEKLAPFIKKYLKTAVSNGSLIQAKGKGASGSFKLSASSRPAPKTKRSTTKTTEKKNVKKTTEKKVTKPKKRMEKKTAPKPKKTEKKTETKLKKTRTPKKEKKAKAPKKPKSPKPKKSPAKKAVRK